MSRGKFIGRYIIKMTVFTYPITVGVQRMKNVRYYGFIVVRNGSAVFTVSI